MKRLVRLVILVALGAAAAAAVRALRREGDPLPAPATSPSAPWPPLRPEPAPVPPQSAGAEPVAAEPAAPTGPTAASGGDGWAEPTDDGECPPGFELKANMKSKIFHAPGQLNYDRTTPDRCYASAEAAEADGLRAAKR